MYQPWVTLLVALQALPLSGAAVLLPELGGPFKVGTVAVELIDHGRTDPLAPTPQARDLMVSFFYPTAEDPKNLTLAPSFAPRTADFLNRNFGVPPGTAESITTRAYLNAPLLHRRRRCQASSERSADDLKSDGWPVLVFSPGFGVTRLEYSAQVSDIASRGYIVAAVDHPFDAPIVEYPDGRIALSNPARPLPDFPGGIEGALAVRVADLIFVLNALSNLTIPGIEPSNKGKHNSALALDQAGVFGHSFGGAASAQAMHADPRFAAGINEDGALFGPVAARGLTKPFMILAGENHTLSGDATWAGFWNASQGQKWLLRIKGATHGSFIDYPAILDALGPGVVPPGTREIFGMVEGKRMLEIEGSYVASFFRKFLEGGKGKLLEGESVRFPEIVFDAKKDEGG